MAPKLWWGLSSRWKTKKLAMLAHLVADKLDELWCEVEEGVWLWFGCGGEVENVYHKPCFQSDVLTLYMHQLREEGDMLSGGRYRVGCHEERDGACGHEWKLRGTIGCMPYLSTGLPS